MHWAFAASHARACARVERLRGYDKLPDRDACGDGRSFQGDAVVPAFAGSAGDRGLGPYAVGERD